MMDTVMDKNEKYLRKQFHILLSKAGIDKEGKLDLLESYNVTSSSDLDADQLQTLCNQLAKIAMPNAAEMDKYRKGLIAAIGAWLRALKQEEGINKIKAIACRASGKEHFNQIPKERLISLYYAFVNKTKDLQFVEALTTEELTFLTLSN